MFTLILYTTPAGKCPIAEFIGGLPRSLQAKAVRDLEILQERDHQLREPYSKYLKDGLLELRIQAAGDAARIFYFFFSGKTIVAVDGFVKKSPKTPPGQIEKALRYKAEFEGRRENAF